HVAGGAAGRAEFHGRGTVHLYAVLKDTVWQWCRMADGLKVAHLVMSLDFGGLERIVVDLVREGQKRGQPVSGICLEGPGTLARMAESCGARLFCVHKEPGIRLSTFRRLKDIIREIDPDVIHTHTIGALFYCGPAARELRVPVVVHTEHTNNIGYP